MVVNMQEKRTFVDVANPGDGNIRKNRKMLEKLKGLKDDL